MTTDFFCSVDEFINILGNASEGETLCIHVVDKNNRSIIKGIPTAESFLFSHSRTRLTYLHLLSDECRDIACAKSVDALQIKFPTCDGKRLYYCWFGSSPKGNSDSLNSGSILRKKLLRNMEKLITAHASSTASLKSGYLTKVTRGAEKMYEDGYEFYYAFNEVRFYLCPES